jgi:beta-phosphoglucomutase
MTVDVPPPVRGVVFDFDGVLANTERVHLAAIRDAFAEVGWALTDEDYFGRYLGYNDADTVAVYARDRGLAIRDDQQRALVAQKAAAYQRRLAGADVLYPEAAACVGRLASTFTLAIASGSLQSEILAILAAGGLRAPFGAIVGADNVSRGKPAPDSYLEAARQLSIEPRACVAIEDSSWGLTAARAAGMQTIAITTTAPAARLSAADRIVTRLDEITVELIGGLVGPRRL